MAEKILIVDDDMDTLRLVGLMLQRQGYQILAANTGTQAVETAKKEQPDLILLDIMMPDLDGYEVTKRLRAESSTTAIPIIMFTAKAQVDDKVMGYEVGADDYLTKPTHPQELIAHVKAILTRTKKVRETASLVLERGHMTGILGVKGGLGVSTLALNLAILLRQKTQVDVILTEFRPGFGSISINLGYTRPAGLIQLLTKNNHDISLEDVKNELITHSTGVRLLLASPRPLDAQHLNKVAQFETIAQHLAHLTRYVIVDLGSSLTPVASRVLPLCDNVIVVVEPFANTVTQTKDLLEDLRVQGIGRGRIDVVLVNRIRSSVQMSWGQVQDQLGMKIATVFTPAPELAYQAETNNIPLVMLEPDSLSTQQFAKLTDFLTQKSQRIVA
jgi:CheY-like chemotaxis protein